MTTDDEEKKEEEKKEEEKKEAPTDELTQEDKDAIAKEADAKYEIEMQVIITKIVEKSIFLIKMQVPSAYRLKEKKGGTLIFIKDQID